MSGLAYLLVGFALGVFVCATLLASTICILLERRHEARVPKQIRF